MSLAPGLVRTTSSRLLTRANEPELKSQSESAYRVVKQRKVGAPRPMKMGTTASLWRYDAGACRALQSIILRRPAILDYPRGRLSSRFRRVVWLPFDSGHADQPGIDVMGQKAKSSCYDGATTPARCSGIMPPFRGSGWSPSSTLTTTSRALVGSSECFAISSLQSATIWSASCMILSSL
jgi:hypothetical protein